MQLTIKAARVNRNMTQAEVAAALGVSVTTYQKFESNPDEIRWRHAKRLAKVLNVPCGSLFFGSSPSSAVDAPDDDPCERRSDTQCDNEPCPECPIYPTDHPEV